jgi:hypothetical protein
MTRTLSGVNMPTRWGFRRGSCFGRGGLGRSRRRLRLTQRVIEVGCGRGEFAEGLIRAGIEGDDLLVLEV